MIAWKPFVALASLVLGALQAWDSHAFGVDAFVAVLAAAGVVIPSVVLFVSARPPVWIVGIIISALLLLAARIVAPIPLNGLHLALLPPALYALVFGPLTRLKKEPDTINAPPPA